MSTFGWIFWYASANDCICGMFPQAHQSRWIGFPSLTRVFGSYFRLTPAIGSPLVAEVSFTPSPSEDLLEHADSIRAPATRTTASLRAVFIETSAGIKSSPPQLLLKGRDTQAQVMP